MKIYIDNIIYALQNSGGISVYMHELSSRLLASCPGLRFIEQGDQSRNLVRKGFAIPAGNIIYERRLPLSLLRMLPVQVPLQPGSIFHSSYYRITRQKNVVNIVTVHDFSYELGYVKNGLRNYAHILQKKYAVEKADGIICISENTRKDLLRFYKGIDENKIRVINHAASEVFGKIDSTSSSNSGILNLAGKKFILFVGARVHHKNFNVAVDTVKKTTGSHLVLVGGGTLSVNDAELLNKELPGRHLHLDGISNADLNLLYRQAFCLLYPSSYEGFGIPILEAMQAGCPVVTTNRSSIPEVCGTAALLVPEIEAEAFAARIERLADAGERRQLIARGLQQAGNFSWDRAYQETLSFYREIHRNKFNR
jgi:glycosyltransferase involved in cell wall biosynthesis